MIEYEIVAINPLYVEGKRKETHLISTENLVDAFRTFCHLSEAEQEFYDYKLIETDTTTGKSKVIVKTFAEKTEAEDEA